jgi:outer membrane protein assembly factor BamB
VIEFADAYEDLLVVQDTGAMVSVVESATGRVRWNTQVARTNTRFLGNARRGDSVVVTNETVLFEFDLRTGNTVDRTEINGIATTAPIFFGDQAVLATENGRLVSLNTALDLRVWEYQFDGLIETPPLRIDDGRLAAVSSKGEIRVLELDGPRSVMSARISGDAGDRLVTDGDYLFVASLDQSLYGFDMLDGHRLWRMRTSAPVTVRPVLLDGVLIATTADKGLTAIDSATGEVVWSNPEIGGWVVTTDDGDLMVWSGVDLLRVDADRGDVIGRARFENLSGLRADRQEDGNIYAIARDGAVAKFSPR